MRTVEEQLQLTLGAVAPLPALEVSLPDVRGCVLAEDVTATHPIPSFDTVLVTGYAVCAADLTDARPHAPVALAVVDAVPAGYRSTTEVAPGTAIRVESGAMLPVGADAVVAVESTNGDVVTVLAYRSVAIGQSVRRRGCAAAVGSVILPRGLVLTECEVGMAVAAGRATVLVHPKPRVVVIATGSELVEPGAPLEPGLVHDANSIILMSAVQGAGGQAYRGGPVHDDAEALSSMIADQLVRADVIVVTGGVAPGGATDQVLSSTEAFDLTRTAVDPGPVVGAGAIGASAVPVFGLPGDPASALIAFEVFVRPVIRRLLGYPNVFRPVVQATLNGNVHGRPGVRRFIAANLTGTGDRYSVTPLEPVTGALSIGVLNANALIIVREQVTHQVSGDRVHVIRLDRDR